MYNHYFSDFDHSVYRDDDKTVITISKLNMLTATYMMFLCRKRFNWSGKQDFQLKWQGAGLNNDLSFTITIPAPTDPRHTRDPFNKEWVGGFFSGIKQSVNPKSAKELFVLCEELNA